MLTICFRLMNLYRQNLQVPPVLQQPGNFQPKTATELPQKKLAPQNQLQPQKKKARVKTVGKPSDASSVSDSGSDDSGESDLEVEEADEPSPIPATRPSEPAAAAEYDTLQAVWSPRNKPPSVDKVKNALVSFKDVVKAVRDTWKESTQSMKMAENKDENDKAAKIKEEVVLQRRLINVVISTTLEKGHPKIVEKYVNSHSHSLTTNLPDRCYGHRSQKRIESLPHVVLLVVDTQHVFLIMAISKGNAFCAREQSLGICPRQWRVLEFHCSSDTFLRVHCGCYSQSWRYVEDPTDAFEIPNKVELGPSILLRLFAATSDLHDTLNPDY